MNQVHWRQFSEGAVFLGWQYPGWKFSLGGNFPGVNFWDDSFPCDSFPKGSFPGGSFPGGNFPKSVKGLRKNSYKPLTERTLTSPSTIHHGKDFKFFFI